MAWFKTSPRFSTALLTALGGRVMFSAVLLLDRLHIEIRARYWVSHGFPLESVRFWIEACEFVCRFNYCQRQNHMFSHLLARPHVRHLGRYNARSGHVADMPRPYRRTTLG